MFTNEYDCFLIDDGPEYDMFEFDDFCTAVEGLIASATKFDSTSASLELKALPDYLKYSFFGTQQIFTSYYLLLTYTRTKRKIDCLTQGKVRCHRLDFRGYQGY